MFVIGSHAQPSRCIAMLRVFRGRALVPAHIIIHDTQTLPVHACTVPRAYTLHTAVQYTHLTHASSHGQVYSSYRLLRTHHVVSRTHTHRCRSRRAEVHSTPVYVEIVVVHVAFTVVRTWYRIDYSPYTYRLNTHSLGDGDTGHRHTCTCACTCAHAHVHVACACGCACVMCVWSMPMCVRLHTDQIHLGL